MYFICMGNISDSLQQTKLSIGNAIVVAFSIILHSIIYTKIWIQKRKSCPPSITIARSNHFVLKDMEKYSFSSIAVALLYLSIVVIFSFCSASLSRMKLSSLNLSPNYLLIYFNNLFLPGFVSFSLITLFYQKRGLRRAVFEEIRSCFS